jgi:hypothetical protein
MSHPLKKYARQVQAAFAADAAYQRLSYQTALNFVSAHIAAARLAAGPCGKNEAIVSKLVELVRPHARRAS